MDDLNYFYAANSNQLQNVSDATNSPLGFKDGINTSLDYSYDDNGNMIVDNNKGITAIVYNHLNLPNKISFANGGIISYFYNAMGQKVKKVVLENAVTTTTDYLTGYQYKNESLQFFPHSEGYVNFTQASKGAVPTDTFNYAFNYVDHLGNVRLTYSQDPLTLALRIMEENHYYPFGLKHSGYNSDQLMYIKQGTTTKIVPVPPLFTTSYQYKFSSKEFQDELGLNWYDFGGRQYMQDIVRTTTLDQKAEKFSSMSPYLFLNNNPLSFIDPTGMETDASGNTRDDRPTYRNGHWSDAVRGVGQSGNSQTPPEDVTVNSSGKVTNVVKNGKPNRFFDEKGNELKSNDSSFDNEYLSGKWNVGDQLFTPVAINEFFKYLLKAGLMPNSSLGLIKRYVATAYESHAVADFGHNQLISAYKETYANTEYAGGGGNGTFYRFQGTNTLYDLGDAGNFMWGAWMSLNNYSYREVKFGSQMNNILFGQGLWDTKADQRAISNGFKYLTK